MSPARIIGHISTTADGARVTRTGAGLTITATGQQLQDAGAPRLDDLLKSLVPSPKPDEP